jgi:hypothetical protein
MNRYIQIKVAIKEKGTDTYAPDRSVAESSIDVPLPTDGKALVETITSTAQQLAANVARHRPEEKPAETPWTIGETQAPAPADADELPF